jgi:hypothetical protein
MKARLPITRQTMLLALGTVSLIPYIWALKLQDLRQHTVAFLGIYGLALVLYALAVSLAVRLDNLSRHVLIGVFGLAAAVCALLVFTPPTLSDDMYRYVWDGRLQAQGISPYRYPPNAPELARLRDAAVWPQINRKSAVTIYPPLAELAFAGLWRVWPDSVRWFQIAMATGGLATGALLVGWLRDAGRSTARIVIFLWSPLLLFETAHAAHVDGLALPLLVGAWWARARGKDALVGGLLGAATALKLYPAFLFPALWRADHPQGRWRMPLIFVVTLTLLYLPYLAQNGAGVIGFLPGYLKETFNLSPLALGLWAVFRPLGIDPRRVAALLALAALAVSSLWMLFHPATGETAARRSAWLIGIVTLFSQNLFSWYMLWLLPLLTLFLAPGATPAGRVGLRLDAWTGWWLFCGLVGLSYTFFVDWQPVPTAIWVQFLPLYLFLGLDVARRCWKNWPKSLKPGPG